MERSFVMIKPDAIEKNLIGKIIGRFEDENLVICTAKLIRASEAQVKELYTEHEGKEFYQGLVDFALSGPIMPLVVQGENAVSRIRKIIGKTNPNDASSGTIRGDFGKGQELPANIIHASDSQASAEREILIFFTEDELCR